MQTYDSFELLLDTPELAIALIDGTLYASTAHAEATPDEILLAAAEATLFDALAGEVNEVEPTPSKLTPLAWTPPKQ